ncbi:DUF4224 domain-containing protein [Dickeya dadantii]|uniref:DUF4224 domain-containing protein n=1 Tax=Dickeya dadantii TaxID=204038 RepID=UPI00057717A5|nr:DUF4224 domain-containing protein [Dickeya dadantii]
MGKENDILSEDDLMELTGYKYASGQIKILTRNGISFIPNKDGHPRTTWAHVNAVLNGTPAPELEDDDAGINFDGI